MANKKPEKRTVKSIFETMDYGNVTENTELAVAWLEKHDLKIPSTPEEIEQIILNAEKQSKAWMNLPGIAKTKLLNGLAAEIERHSTLICQLELLTRRILTKDTKTKSIQLLTDYLRYYASWACLLNKHFPNHKPYGTIACYVDKDAPLSILGAILAPALASGNTIILGVSLSTVPIACLISQLCKNIGFPDAVLNVVMVSNIEEFLTHKDVKKIVYIGNLCEKIISEKLFSTDKDLTTFHLGNLSSMIVFDNADLDSACDSVTESTWAYGRMFPCGINKIFIQEPIFHKFVEKLTSKIEKLNVNYFTNFSEKTTDILIDAEITNQDKKIDMINKLPLKIGNKHFGSNIINDEQNSYLLSVVPFRTASEAANLVNNSRFGLAVSVWTENISLANEMVSKIKAGIVWVNNHGYISANASFTPLKESGRGYFGGVEGLLEYLKSEKTNDFKIEQIKTAKIDSQLPSVAANKRTLLYYGGSFKKSESGLIDGDSELPNRKDVRNCVEIAKKNYETWSKMQSKVRSQLLWKLADSSKISFPANEKWVEYLQNWALLSNCSESLVQQGSPELKIIRESVGLIAVEMYSDPNYTCLDLVAAALAYGNAVIIVNCSNEMNDFLTELCKIISSCGFPPGIFNVIFNPNVNVIQTLIEHREVQVYFQPQNKILPFRQIKKIKNIANDQKDVIKQITNNKCVWTSNGQSFL